MNNSNLGNLNSLSLNMPNMMHMTSLNSNPTLFTNLLGNSSQNTQGFNIRNVGLNGLKKENGGASFF